MKYRCHQCFAIVDFHELAHTDMYSDLCWLQCETCAAAFGNTCGLDRRANPHPHGYFSCPLRVDPPRRDNVIPLHRVQVADLDLPDFEPHSRESS